MLSGGPYLGIISISGLLLLLLLLVLAPVQRKLLLLLLGDVLNNVGRALVAADVSANLLFEGINPEHIHPVEKINVGAHDTHNPTNDPDN